MNVMSNGMFYEQDITYLFRSQNLNEAQKRMDQIKAEIGKTGKPAKDYDILDRMSNGRGTEAYQKLTQHRFMSKEYYSAFQFFQKKKTINLNTPEGVKLHVERNKNMYKKAPKDLATMMKFVKHGYFIYEGYSPCHNLTKEKDTRENRLQTLQQAIYLHRHNLLGKKNKFAPLDNISFRGTPGTSFEGCQFIYNSKTGKLVVDNVNRGTWDFGKYATAAHWFFDLYPWVNYGNGENKETADLFIMPDAEEKKYLAAAVNSVEIDQNAQYSVLKTALDFLKDTTKNKFGKRLVTSSQFVSQEDLDEEAVDGNDYLEAEQERVTANRMVYIEKFINKNVSRLVHTYNKDWIELQTFMQSVSNGTLLSGLGMFTSSCYADNTSIFESDYTSADAVDHYKAIMKAVLTGTPPENVKEGEIVPINIPSMIVVNMNPRWTNNIKGLEDNAKAVQEFQTICDFIVEQINEKNKKAGINVSVRIVTGNIGNTFDEFQLSISQNHVITHSEEVILGKKNFLRQLDNPEDVTMEEVPFESTEYLNVYHKPEYLE